MIKRKGPDGVVRQFPDGTSEEEMATAFSSIYSEPEGPYVAQQHDYDDIQDQFTDTSQAAVEDANQIMDRNQQEFGSVLSDSEGTGVSPTGALLGQRDNFQDGRPQNLQELGTLNVAEGVIPASIEIIGGAVTAAAKVLSNVTPDFIENPTVNAVLDIGTAIKDSPLMEYGIELAKENYPKYLTWAKENPFYDRAIKAVFNLSALATKTPVSKLDKVADALTTSGNKLSFANRTKKVEQMLEPIHPETSDMTVSATPTTTEGLLGRIVPVYTDDAKEIINITALVPKLKPTGSFSESRNTIYAEISNTAEKLKKDIHKAGNPTIDINDVATQLQDAADNLKESVGYSLSGGTTKFADDLMSTAIRFVNASDGTAAGLLDARQKLDSFITKHQPSSMTQDYINSKAKAVAEIRSIMNQVVIDSVPNVDVTGLLAKQHKLYRAWDVVGDKAVQEGRLAITRTFNDIVRNQITMPRTPRALAYTITGSGYWAVSGNAAYTIGAVAGVAATAVGYKVMTGPKLRQSLGWLLKGISKTLEKTKATAAIEQLKADRLILIGMLNDLEKNAERPPLLSAANQ